MADSLAHEFTERSKKAQTVISDFGVSSAASAQASQTNNDIFRNTVAVTGPRINKVLDSSATILSRISELDGNPRIFNSIMGIFDSSFDKKALKGKLKVHEIELQKANTRLTTAKTIHGLNQSSIQAEQKANLAKLDAEVKGLSTLEALIKMEGTTEDRENTRDVRLVRDLTRAQLEGYINDPNTIPAQLKGQEGLIKIAIRAKLADEQGISASTLALQGQELALKTANEKRDLINADDVSLVNIASGNTESATISVARASEEINRRTQLDQAVEQMELVLEARKLGNKAATIDAENKAITDLGKVATPEMIAEIEGSLKDGKATLVHRGQKITLTARQVSQVRAAHSAEEKAAINIGVQTNLTLAGVDARQAAVKSQIGNLAKAIGTGDINPNNPAASLPTSVQLDIQVTAAKLNTLNISLAQTKAKIQAGKLTTSDRNELQVLTTTMNTQLDE